MKLASSKLNSHRGFALVEILVAIAAVGIVVLSIVQITQLFLRVARLSSQRVEAIFLLQEGAEGIRFLRDTSWHDHIDTMTTGTPYYLLFTSGTYSVTANEPALVNGVFQRTITLFDVFRDDTTDDIVQTDGVLSTSTKRIEINVSWKTGAVTTTENMELFLGDIFQN